MPILHFLVSVLPSTLCFFVRSDRHKPCPTQSRRSFSPEWPSFCETFSVLLTMFRTFYNGRKLVLHIWQLLPVLAFAVVREGEATVWTMTSKNRMMAIHTVPFWRTIMHKITSISPAPSMIHYDSIVITKRSHTGVVQPWWNVFTSRLFLFVRICEHRLLIWDRIRWPATFNRSFQASIVLHLLSSYGVTLCFTSVTSQVIWTSQYLGQSNSVGEVRITFSRYLYSMFHCTAVWICRRDLLTRLVIYWEFQWSLHTTMNCLHKHINQGIVSGGTAALVNILRCMLDIIMTYACFVIGTCMGHGKPMICINIWDMHFWSNIYCAQGHRFMVYVWHI